MGGKHEKKKRDETHGLAVVLFGLHKGDELLGSVSKLYRYSRCPFLVKGREQCHFISS